MTSSSIRAIRTLMSFVAKAEHQPSCLSPVAQRNLHFLTRRHVLKAPVKPWALQYVREQHTKKYDSRQAEASDQPQAEALDGEYDPIDSVHPPSLFRPILFTVLVTTGLYFGAAAMTKRSDENFQQSIQQLLRNGAFPINGNWTMAVSLDQRTRVLARIRSLGFPAVLRARYADLQSWWDSQRSSQRAVRIITGLNLVVFLAFRMPIPIVRFWMQRSFTHSPLTGRSYTLLTSTFGHASLAHFAFNMLALNSFGPMAFECLEGQRRQYPWVTDDDKIMNVYSTYHHIAFFITAGMLASLVPHIVDLTYKLPVVQGSMRSVTDIIGGLIGRKSNVVSSESVRVALPQTQILPSLGASGGIYSTLVLSALAFPDASVSLIFLPWIPIDIGKATLCVITLDVLGIVLGWQVFGHWAHLTGGAVGALAFWVEGRLWFEVQRVLEGGRLPRYNGTPGDNVSRLMDGRGSR